MHIYTFSTSSCTLAILLPTIWEIYHCPVHSSGKKMSGLVSRAKDMLEWWATLEMTSHSHNNHSCNLQWMLQRSQCMHQVKQEVIWEEDNMFLFHTKCCFLTAAFKLLVLSTYIYLLESFRACWVLGAWKSGDATPGGRKLKVSDPISALCLSSPVKMQQLSRHWTIQ